MAKLFKKRLVPGLMTTLAIVGSGPFAYAQVDNPEATAPTTGSTFKRETPASADLPPLNLSPESLLGSPTPSPTGFKVETPQLAKPSMSGSVESSAARAPVARPVAASSATSAGDSPVYHKSTMLYGRIEQIAAGKGASFPPLRALTPQFDTRATTLQGKASETGISGNVVSSFPQDYSGTWGGALKIWTFQQDPLAFQVDREKAEYTRLALQPGFEGQVNFNFARDARGKTILEPAQILFQVPMKDTYQSKQVNQMLGGMNGQAGGMNGMLGQMMASMAQNMNVPVMVSLGNVDSSSLMTGVSGNQLHATLLKNTIRELQPGVLEQQIVTERSERNAKTGATENGYDESVIRFTKQSSDQFYVQAAIVSYSDSRKFVDKLILYGTVRKGQVAQTNPMVMPGIGDVSKLLNGAGGAQLNMPGGANPLGPLQNLQDLQNLFPK